MQKFYRRFLPNPATLRNTRLFRLFGSTLFSHQLWCLNRRSVAGGLATGAFCGLIPGPFQMPVAAIICLIWRVNLPLALLATLYTNPFTIVPLYIAAFHIGRFVTQSEQAFVLPPSLGDMHFMPWLHALLAWCLNLGQPLLVGLPLLASGIAVLTWMAVRGAWRLHVLRALQRRRQRSAQG